VGTLSGYPVTEEGEVGHPEDALRRVDYDPLCAKMAEEDLEMALVLLE
jgi:hypothetical protein